jgi:hypothetical protein
MCKVFKGMVTPQDLAPTMCTYYVPSPTELSPQQGDADVGLQPPHLTSEQLAEGYLFPLAAPRINESLNLKQKPEPNARTQCTELSEQMLQAT